MYRINYGNGQVSRTMPDLKSARAELRAAGLARDLHVRVERYDPGSADAPGDWLAVDQKRWRPDDYFILPKGKSTAFRFHNWPNKYLNALRRLAKEPRNRSAFSDAASALQEARADGLHSESAIEDIVREAMEIVRSELR